MYGKKIIYHRSWLPEHQYLVQNCHSAWFQPQICLESWIAHAIHLWENVNVSRLCLSKSVNMSRSWSSKNVNVSRSWSSENVNRCNLDTLTFSELHDLDTLTFLELYDLDTLTHFERYNLETLTFFLAVYSTRNSALGADLKLKLSQNANLKSMLMFRESRSMIY